jgi:ABC-type branched-subunit amino acid transport system ATPase component
MTKPASRATKPLLDVDDLRLAFGGVKAVDGLSLRVYDGDIMSVIGPNGAGKTSAFNCITGFYTPTGGVIRFDDEKVTGLKPSAMARRGMARTFQNLRLFGDLTVLDNVRAGAHLKIGQNFLDAMLHTPRYHHSEQDATDRAQQWLDFVGLTTDRTGLARNLPYGEQRRVEIARALARGPRMLLLDEPAAGLNHTEKNDLLELLRRIGELGIAVVLIEHDMGLVMAVSHRITVLNFGKQIAAGSPDEIRNDPAVVEAYLGSDEAVGGASDDVGHEALDDVSAGGMTEGQEN